MKYHTKRYPYYSAMTSSVKEKLWNELQENGGEDVFIKWDVFSEDYVGEDVPRPNTYDYLVYVKARTNYWIPDINDKLSISKYPCRVFVKRDEGIVVTKRSVLRKRMTFREKQRISHSERTSKEFKKWVDTEAFTAVENKDTMNYVDMLKIVNQIVSRMLSDENPQL
jgi:hypothetical protein